MPEKIINKWCYWVLLNDSESFEANIKRGEKLTKGRYMGISFLDPNYMVFSKKWWEE